MNEHDEGNGEQALNRDKLDRELDAALAKYAAAEPRAGLEQRVLAGLRAERERRAARVWWQTPVVAALATALVLVVAVLAWRLEAPAEKIANQHSPEMQADKPEGAKVANSSGSGTGPVQQKRMSETSPRSHLVRKPEAVVASVPKLDQFPSRQPLSEQERILMRYVTEFPGEATLVAQLRAEDVRREREEELADLAAGAGSEDLDQRVSEKANR